MKFHCYTDWNQLPESAEELFTAAARESVFASRQWLEAVSAEICAGGETILLAGVLAGKNLAGLLPLVRGGGNTLCSLRHRYTPHCSLLLAENDRAQVLACLVRGLSELAVHGVLLEPVMAEDRHLAELQAGLASAGFVCEHHFRHYNWIYRVEGRTYQQFLASRPARLRNTLERKKRKLARDHGYEIRLYTGEEVSRAMPEYYRIYQASWKAREQYTGFLDKIVAEFSRQNWIRLAVLYINDCPAAAQLWFVNHAEASIFRLAYDENWKSYSPGSILTSFLMEYVIDDDKVAQIDFLTGNEPYKQDWMSARRECYALSCVSNSTNKNVMTGNTMRRMIDWIWPRYFGSE